MALNTQQISVSGSAYTQIGTGPAHLQLISYGCAVSIISADTQPAASALGEILSASNPALLVNSSSAIWAILLAGTTPGGQTSATVAVTESLQALQTGTLANSTPLAIPVIWHRDSMSISLHSAYASRLIQLSTNGGLDYFTPAYDVSASGVIVVSATSPITNIQFTGQSGDVWGIL